MNSKGHFRDIFEFLYFYRPRNGEAVANLGMGARGTTQAPNFFRFHAVFGKIWQNLMLVPPWGVGTPLGKSWIRRWEGHVFTHVCLGLYPSMHLGGECEWECGQDGVWTHGGGGGGCGCGQYMSYWNSFLLFKSSYIRLIRDQLRKIYNDSVRTFFF